MTVLCTIRACALVLVCGLALLGLPLAGAEEDGDALFAAISPALTR